MTFRELIAWQKGMDFVVRIYAYTGGLPDSEKYGLVQQLRRAAVSIPSNLAEGYGRTTQVEFARFIDISLGSRREIQTQLEICERLGYSTAIEERKLAEEMAKILYALAKSVRAKLENF